MHKNSQQITGLIIIKSSLGAVFGREVNFSVMILWDKETFCEKVEEEEEANFSVIIW